MPYSDDTDDSVRKLIDEYGRHRLTDVREETEDLGGSVGFSPTRRHHAILTEDTDSFIIGQRVWVGGTKPGKIAYIGETQFAPGEWAGIVLDQAIGKNDGSVAGIRYFQCEPKHGVFSRLTRLTIVPLPGADLGDTSYTFTPPSPVNSIIRRSPLSPTGSTKSLRKSPPPLNTSSTSLSSPSNIDFKMGDRVIIKSSQGSKIGAVRYIGTTEFAPGEWCGVELDEPRGKNDGSVEGKRYFLCRPNYGLFSPITKVSKSPLKYKPGSCIIHSQGGLRKAGSRESMASLTSSMVSGASNIGRVRLGVNSLNSSTRQKTATATPLSTRTALQDVLREKQQHIEQLLKERDLERAEISKAANQADEAEQKLATLTAEYEKYRSECETKLKQFSGLVSTLKLEQGDILSQLDEEKRKNEDILFKFEEAAINKGDIEVENEKNKTRVRELEKELEAEHQKVENLEADSQKLFETEEALVTTRDQLDSLKSEFELFRAKRSDLELEQSTKDDLIKNLQKQLEQTQRDFKKLKEDNTLIIEDYKKQISTVTNSFEDKIKQQEEDLQRYKRELSGKDENCLNQNEEIKKLREELVETKKLLEIRSIDLEKLTKERDEDKKLLEKLKMEISSRTSDIENLNETMTNKDESLKSLKKEYDLSLVNLQAKDAEMSRQKRNAEVLEKELKEEITLLHQSLQNTTQEKQEAEKQYALAVSQKDALLEEKTKSLESSKRDVENLNKEITELKEEVKYENEEARNRHTRQIESREAQLIALTTEMQRKNEEITKCSIVTSKLEDDICERNHIIERLQGELQSLRTNYNSQQNSHRGFSDQLGAIQVENGELRRKLKITEQFVAELTQDKNRLEKEIQAVMSSSGDNVKLGQITNEMVAREHQFAEMEKEYRLRIQQCEKAEDILKVQVQQILTEKQSLEHQLQQAHENEITLKKNCDATLIESKVARDELIMQLAEIRNALNEKDRFLQNALKESAEKERHYKIQLESSHKELQKMVSSCTAKVEEAELEVLKLKNQLASKSEQFIDTESKIKLCIFEAEQRENEIRRSYEEQLRKKAFEIGEKDAAISTLHSELQLVKKDCASNNVDINEKNLQLAKMNEEINQLRRLLELTQREKDDLQLSQSDMAQKLLVNSQQCTDLMNQIAELTRKAKLADQLAQELEIERAHFLQFVQQLKLGEAQKQRAIANLQKTVEASGEYDRCKQVLELAKGIQTSLYDEDRDKIAHLQNLLDNANRQAEEKERQIEMQRQEILNLQNQLLQVHQSPISPSPLTPGHKLNQNSNEYANEDTEKLLEEKKLAESQIDFLNSIIVDMQKKNAEQKARIEILESGYSPAAADELKLIGLPNHRRPPRVYCDICEEFDQHETEDCPIQATEDNPDPCQKFSKRSPPPPRSYCEICEMFGHCTEDCKDDQTF